MTAAQAWDRAITERIGSNIRTARGRRSAQWLADRTEDLKFPIGRATISELETGRRKTITVAELLVLAYALDTSPVMLMYGDQLADGKIEEIPGLTITAERALFWHNGLDDSGVAKNPADYEQNNQAVAPARLVLGHRLRPPAPSADLVGIPAPPWCLRWANRPLPRRGADAGTASAVRLGQLLARLGLGSGRRGVQRMTMLLVAIVSLSLGIWWGRRWADWSARVDRLIEEARR